MNGGYQGGLRRKRRMSCGRIVKLTLVGLVLSPLVVGCIIVMVISLSGSGHLAENAAVMGSSVQGRNGCSLTLPECQKDEQIVISIRQGLTDKKLIFDYDWQVNAPVGSLITFSGIEDTLNPEIINGWYASEYKTNPDDFKPDSTLVPTQVVPFYG